MKIYVVEDDVNQAMSTRLALDRDFPFATSDAAILANLCLI